MKQSLLMAFALLFVLEGILPFIVPQLWREIFRRMTTMSDGQIRFFGLSSMLLGIILLVLFR
jgi:uncharacterized protein YjeT (DUF2065 family)